MNFSDDTLYLIEFAGHASQMAREQFSILGSNSSLKEDLSPVTETDIAINKLVIEDVKKQRCEWAVIGEEQQWNTGSNIKLLVDPIDGTKPFIWGQATFGCMFALVQEGVVISAVVVNPILKRTVVAEKGQGTHILENETKLIVSETNDIKAGTVYLHSKSVLCAQDIIADKGSYVAGNSAAEIAVKVAKGSWAGAILNLPSPHDLAPIKLIVEEAGGGVTDLQGKEQRYDDLLNGVIVSNGYLHGFLLDCYHNYY